MKYQELIGKSKKEILLLMQEQKSRLYELVFLKSQGKVKNIHEMAALKRDLARLATFLNTQAK